MKKVLYIITKSDTGGAQKYVRDLSENLDKNEFKSRIIYGGKDLKWLSNKTSPWFLFFNDWMAIFEMVKLFKKENPDIIHLNSSKAGVLGTISAKIYGKGKIIFTAHGWVFNPDNAIAAPVRQFYILLHKIAALFQDEIICVSEYDRQLAIRYKIAPQEKIVTIYNGVNPDINFLDKNEARNKIIKKLPAFSPELSNKRWIGSIGRLTKEKNYETLIRAAALLPSTPFFIIGSGPESEKLKLITYNLKLNNLFLIEPEGEDFKYLTAFDVFTLSSIKEGLPYTLLEAMTAELPAIVTKAGGMPEIIKNNENGFVVPQKNPQALADAISKVRNNQTLAVKFKTSAAKTVQEKFLISKMISKTEEIYKA
ncbi:MAG: glycosyltransferase family 4 protein [Candidatus Pacebacteria bacterium]|nr:glycosyltransferase family 4 protein [Candidatus Paceibacterota bacterium]